MSSQTNLNYTMPETNIAPATRPFQKRQSKVVFFRGENVFVSGRLHLTEPGYHQVVAPPLASRPSTAAVLPGATHMTFPRASMVFRHKKNVSAWIFHRKVVHGHGEVMVSDVDGFRFILQGYSTAER